MVVGLSVFLLSVGLFMGVLYQYFGNQLNYLNGDLGLSQLPSRILDAETGAVIRD